jgi:hypothetical protein
MKHEEQQALTVLREAWAALAGKDSAETVVHHLHRLERNTPELFLQVIDQLESDNGRWAPQAEMPVVEICRSEKAEVEAVIFSQASEGLVNIEEPDRAFIWVSDNVDIKWVEEFVRELLNSGHAHAECLVNKPPLSKWHDGNQKNTQP